jgi:hypothetical protein
MKTLGEIVDAVMSLSPEERRLLLQMLESSQQPSTVKPESVKTFFKEDGRLSTGTIQNIMDELSAALDRPNQF